jgi:hypothetical protein
VGGGVWGGRRVGPCILRMRRGAPYRPAAAQMAKAPPGMPLALSSCREETGGGAVPGGPRRPRASQPPPPGSPSDPLHPPEGLRRVVLPTEVARRAVRRRVHRAALWEGHLDLLRKRRRRQPPRLRRKLRGRARSSCGGLHWSRLCPGGAPLDAGLKADHQIIRAVVLVHKLPQLRGLGVGRGAPRAGGGPRSGAGAHARPLRWSLREREARAGSAPCVLWACTLPAHTQPGPGPPGRTFFGCQLARRTLMRRTRSGRPKMASASAGLSGDWRASLPCSYSFRGVDGQVDGRRGSVEFGRRNVGSGSRTSGTCSPDAPAARRQPACEAPQPPPPRGARAP